MLQYEGFPLPRCGGMTTLQRGNGVVGNVRSGAREAGVVRSLRSQCNEAASGLTY